jgi:ribonucleoside-triphosphate reductase
MSERISSSEVCKRLVRTALSRFRLPYITITPTFSICPTHGHLAGEHEFCPRCDAERIAAKREGRAAPDVPNSRRAGDDALAASAGTV